MKNQYCEFWGHFLGLSTTELLSPDYVINSSGRYIEKHQDKFVFLYQDLKSLKKVLVASSKNVEKFKFKLDDLKCLNLDTAKDFKKMTLEFHDIDYGLTSAALFIPSNSFSKSIEIRKLSPNDLEASENFKNSCSEDDVDTLDFNLETDIAYGAFLQNKLIGVSRYLVLRDTKIADITVVISSEYRNQKISTPLVSKIVESILADSLTPKYRVQTENIASIKIAQRLGFKPLFQILTWEANQTELA